MDDAPFEPHTTAILNILDRYRIRTTFFVVGKHARSWPKSLKAILAKGHEIGNHTEMHLPLTTLDPKAAKMEIFSLQAHLQTTCGVRPRFFRPPEGKVNFESLRMINEAGMDLIFWDVDPQDWSSPGMIGIATNVAHHVQPGSIILFHTVNPQSVETLPVLIEYLKAENYKFVTLSELLGRSPYLPALSIDTRATTPDPRPK